MALTLDVAGYVYGEGTAYATRALEGVSLSLEPGGLAVVLGATGSGKSTMLRLAAGLVAPTSGEVSVDGRRPHSPQARGLVGLVFQRPEAQLFAETVGDDVAFGPRNFGRTAEEARRDAARALDTVGLDPAEFAPRSPFTLSGGEARRVAIAGVLAMRPAYLLLDEPTAGLDARGRDAVLTAVETARAEGAGVLVVTHDAEEFLPLAERVLVLAEGAPAFSGPAGELLADPSPLDAAGLAVPPVLAVQLRARAAGLAVPMLTLDPVLAAEVLSEAAR